MTAQSPSQRWIEERLDQIAQGWDAALEKLRQENRHSEVALALELPYSVMKKVWSLMAETACIYVQMCQNEVCPDKGSLTLEQAWPHVLLAQAREIRQRALGDLERDRAYSERLYRRQRIVLEGALGDLQRAAPERIRVFYRVSPVGGEGWDISNRRLKALLFRAVLAQAKALRDRFEGGELWFPNEVATVQIGEVARIQSIPEIEASPSLPSPPMAPSSASELPRPGRKPQRETESYQLVNRYLMKLMPAVPSRKVTKNKLARALNISRDTLNVFEREITGLSTETRDKIQTELMTGPSGAVIAFFIPQH